MTQPSYQVIADFVGSGQTVPYQDITQIRVKRSVASFFERYQVGRGSLMLDNSGNKYTQSLQVNQDVQVNAISPTGSVYVLFKGTVETYAFNPAPGQDEVLLSMVDYAHKLRTKLSLPLATNTNVSSTLTEVFSSAGFAGTALDVSSGLDDSVPFQYIDDVQAGAAAYEVLQAAGIYGFIKGDGTAIIRDRNFDLSVSATSSLASFFQYRAGFGRSRLINRATLESEPRKPGLDVGTVATYEEQTELTSSESVIIFMDHIDPDNRERRTPVNSFVTPVASQDFMFTTQVSEAGSIINDGLSLQLVHYALTTKATLTNGSSVTGYVSRLQLRGIPIKRQPGFKRTFETSSSIATYGLEEFVVTNDLITDPLFADTYAQALTGQYSDPPLELDIAIKNQFPDVYWTELLSIVHVVNSQTAVASDFLVFDVEHNIDFRKGLEHTLSLGLQLVVDKNFLLLGRDPEGKLDQRRLGF